MKTFSISVYYRRGDFVVVPQSGGGGLYFAVDGIVSVPVDRESLARAIEDAAAHSDVTLGVVNLRNYKSPIPKAVRMRSHRAFDRSVLAVCGVLRTTVDVELELSRHAN